jgi:Cu+-exporting ATPase
VRHVASLKPSAGSAPAEAATLEKDPVCGMDVRVTGGTPSFAHDGRTYHFCSEQCRDRFARDPEAVLARPGAHGMQGMGDMTAPSR